MDWQILSGVNWSFFIDWLTNDVHNSTEGGWSHWHHDWVSSVGDLLASDETFGIVQSNGSHVVSTQVLGDLEHKSVVHTLHLESVQDWGEVSLELHVNDGTDNLGDFTNARDLLGEVSYSNHKLI